MTQELSIPKGGTARAVHSDDVLVELTDLDDRASFVPLPSMMADLVLYAHSIANTEGW